MHFLTIIAIPIWLFMPTVQSEKFKPVLGETGFLSMNLADELRFL